MNFTFLRTDTTIEYRKHWEFCIGSCHAATALRQDYREQLAEVRRELGIRYLRFHGLFDDDMSVLQKSMFSSDYIFSFTNIDNIYDYLLSIGMKPFVEIGFMPNCLKSGTETIFHYKANITPPKDPTIWVRLLKEFISHLIERYGRDEVRTWYFEIWNEPNLDGENGLAGGRFWSGSMDDYYELYRITVSAIKELDPQMRVGGPATSNNAHIPEMIAYCREKNVPLDFISTHHYPTDVVLGYGVEDSKNFVKEFNSADKTDVDTVQRLLKHYLTFQEDIWAKVDRGVLTEMARRAKRESENLPLFYTEWNSLSGIESDGPFGAAFIAKTVLDNIGIVDGSAYWTFSDIFEEKGMPNAAFHGGFGLITMQGIKKASYRAFELLHRLPERKYTQNFSEGNVDCYFFLDERDCSFKILAVNHHSLMHEIHTEEIALTIRNQTNKLMPEGDIYRIDDSHANALQKWKELAMPLYLTEYDRDVLHAASHLRKETIVVDQCGDEFNIRFTLPPQGLALIVLYETK